MVLPRFNSSYIKTVLMAYWRFKRHCACSQELGYDCFLADVIVLNKSNFIQEIEIKTAKNDLCCAELIKRKHKLWKPSYPNYFSFAVPTELIDDAIKIIEQINPKYGLIEIKDDKYNPILLRRSCKLIHNNKDKLERWKDKIMLRNTSALVGYMQDKHCTEGYNVIA